jgi:hypothetical protein
MDASVARGVPLGSLARAGPCGAGRRTRLGLTLFSETENEWRNQNGEHVKTRISTGIRY